MPLLWAAEINMQLKLKINNCTLSLYSGTIATIIKNNALTFVEQIRRIAVITYNKTI